MTSTTLLSGATTKILLSNEVSIRGIFFLLLGFVRTALAGRAWVEDENCCAGDGEKSAHFGVLLC